MAHQNEQPILNVVGKRVALGPLRKDLLPLYQRWINDLSVSRNVGSVLPMTLEQEAEWYESATASQTGVTFTIYERSSLRPLGTSSLSDIDHRHRRAEFGIFIGEGEFRGRGLGTETTRLMLEYAFTALDLHNVMLRVFEGNRRAVRAYEKAGFRRFGQRTQAHRLDGQVWDEIYMECLSSEFENPVLRRVFAPDAPRGPENQSGPGRP